VVHSEVHLWSTLPPAASVKSMTTTAPSTRQRLVDAAVRRFYRDGFRNVGVDQVLSDVGISKTAFYKHFESKDDLMVAALEQQNDWFQDTFRTIVRERGGPTALGQLDAAFDVVEHIMDAENFQGCIFVNAAVEFPLPHEPAHVLALKNKRALEDLLFTLAGEAQAADPRALAQELCLVMEGAYVTRVVSGNKNAVDIARRIAKLAITAHCEVRA
jgi:AcrR family transcriptional regulator